MTKKVERVYLIKSRKWPVFQFHHEDGSRTYQSVHCDHSTADELLVTMRNRIALGTFYKEDFFQHQVKSISLGEAATRYIDKRDRDVSLNQISNKTLETDLSTLKVFIDVVGKHARLHQVNKKIVENFMHKLKNERLNQYGKHYSDGSIRTYLKHLSSFFSWAKENELVEENPVFGIKKPGNGKLQNPHHRLLDEGQIETLREYFKSKPGWQLDIFNFSMWTSARRSEAFDFKKEDFLTLKVHGEDKYFVRLFGKGNKVRIVPIGNACVREIEKRISYLYNEKEFYKLVDSKGSVENTQRYHLRWKEGYLFFDVAEPNSISKAFMRARKACDIPESITFHSARHTFATHLLAEGVDIKVVSELLGHADLKTTEIYAKVLNNTIMNQTKHVTEL